MPFVLSDIGATFKGSSYAFIYVWFSKAERFVYVGQTNDRYGSLGRAYSHVSQFGTLRERCLDRVGLSLEQVPDLKLFSYALPELMEYRSTESSYRLGVEYLVQFRLIKERHRAEPVYQVISNIATSDCVGFRNVQNLAEQIVETFWQVYRSS